MSHWLKLTLLLLLTLAFKTQAEAKANLHIETLSLELQSKLKSQYPQVLEKTLTLSEAEEILKWLHNQVDHDLVQLWLSGEDQLEFKIIKRIRVKKITWKGLKQISENEALRLLGIQVNDVFENETLVTGGERIRKAYQEIGYSNTQIDLEFPTRSDGNIELTISVNENKQTQISDIHFESPNEVLNLNIKKAVNTFFKEALTQESIDRIYKKSKEYLIDQRYSRAEITGPEISYNADETLASLKFKVDKIEKYEFLFKGNVYYNSTELSDDLDLANFYSASSNIGTELAQKLRVFYQSEGYARSEIQVDEKEDRAKFLRTLTFNITEGPRIKIEKIQITGKMTRDENYYIELLTQNASKLFKNGYYSREDIEAAANNLKIELQNQGFLLAKILTIRTPLTKEKNKVPILITIDEGPLTEVETIVFDGIQKVTRDELLKISGLSLQGPLQLNKVEASLQKIKDYYKGHGFLEMNIENEKTDLVTYLDENKKAILKFKIFEGPQVRVASLVLEGNTFTQDRVIMNELDFSVGEILTPQKIEDSILRLQRTGYFGSVEIRTLEEKTAVANRTVVVRVTEREPGLFTIGFGGTNERQFTIRGYTGVAYRNIKGTGRGISLRLEGNYNVAQIKYPEYKATVGYLEPYLFDTRFRGRWNLTRSRLITDSSARIASESIKTTFSIERDLTSHITAIWDIYSMTSSRDFGIDGNIQDVLIDIATTGFILDMDYRNSPFNPTAGMLSKFTIEYGSPTLRSTDTIEFWKTTASFTHYKALYKNSVVWANNIRGGYLSNLSKHPLGGVPYDKVGFILGGQSTIRGFEAGTNEVFPNYTDLGIGATDTFYLKEQARMGLIKSELRFPLYGNITGATFYDGGSVVLTEKTFADSYRDSVGVGIRYNTPVGPLSIDFGWKLDRKAGEETGRFHLSFGSF